MTDKKMEIGIIGIGLMGRAFVERFSSQGYHVKIFNRTPDHISDLPGESIEICGTVKELLDQCNTIILMLSDIDAINDILSTNTTLGDKTIIQMATISPTQSRDVAIKVDAYGGSYLEAPVLGSIPEAKSGSLIIMAGGSKALYDTSLPLLQVLGSQPKFIGDTGSAAALKLAMNQLIASLTSGFSLSLGYAIEHGVDTDLFMDVVRDSALYAKTYDKKLEKYLSRDFGAANFSTQHLLKDIRLFIDDANTAGLNTDALQGIEKITHETVNKGFQKMDYSSIFDTIAPSKEK